MADGNVQAGFGFGEAVVATAVEPEPLTKHQRRSRRARAVRAKTISTKRMTRAELEMGRLMFPPSQDDYARPATRGDCFLFRAVCTACDGRAGACVRCNGSGLHFVQNVGDAGHWRVNGPAAYAEYAAMTADARAASGIRLRPCGFVSCAHHLYLDVSERTGAIKQNFPDLEPDDMKDSCALDVIDRGGITLEETGAIMNLTRERIRQLEVKALGHLRASGDPDAARLAEHVDAPAEKRRLPVVRSSDLPQHRRGYEPPTPGSSSPVDDPRGWRDSVGASGQRTMAPSDLPGTNWSGRERALARAAVRLGRFTADALLRAAGCAGEAWMVGRMVGAGLIRQDGDSYVWIGEVATAAE